MKRKELNCCVGVMLSAPGIGKITAIFIICCTNNFAIKITGKQLADYAGVVPFENTSGTSVKGRSRVHFMANKDLKSLLTMGPYQLSRYTQSLKIIMSEKQKKARSI